MIPGGSSRHKNTYYFAGQAPQKPYRKYIIIAAVLLFIGAAFLLYGLVFSKDTPQKAANRLNFESSVAPSEQERIKTAITDQALTYEGTATVSAQSSFEQPENSVLLEAYLPVADKYSVRQSVTAEELKSLEVFVSAETEPTIRESIQSLIDADVAVGADTSQDGITFMPLSQISPQVKVLAFDNSYYLDDFAKGAVLRTISFSGTDTGSLASLNLNNPGKESVLTINQTGVTALTRRMIPKLQQVGDPTFFSKEIGPFLASADITHVSNEVSFQEGCRYHNALFCSPPEFIETLKHSGVDLVELTGNHNNDVGRQYNTNTINQYHQLGWATVGGGLNTEEAAKPYFTDKKGSKVAILAYNYPDSPNGGAIATQSGAGANSFDFDRIKSDIEAAKGQGAQSVVVDVQFWECYAYPNGYVEYPVCDQPIQNQKEVFRKLVDLGADTVVGTSAHQPQTYEFYNGKPIYYGLGNLYFEQTQWPGTERGIILTHYYHNGHLLQTKLTPTVYGKDFQTRVMNADETAHQLERLHSARQAAGLD